MNINVWETRRVTVIVVVVKKIFVVVILGAGCWGVQTEGVLIVGDVHVHPFYIIQLDEQPSLEKIFPSSQVSPTFNTLLPQGLLGWLLGVTATLVEPVAPL